MSAPGHDPGQVLDRLVAAGVQFVVVVGDPPGGPLRLVVSQHPANLSVLGQVLDRVGAAVRTSPERSEKGPRPLVGKPGILPLSTPFGDVDLLFGPSGGSLYASTVERSSEGVVGGVAVREVQAVAEAVVVGRGAAERLRQRLLDLADAVAERFEHERRPPGADSGE